MAEKDLNIGYLASFYRNLLTEKQYEALSLYYDEDLSLGEIGDLHGISRQGVRDAIKRAEEMVFDFESKLHLAEKFRSLSEDISLIVSDVNQISDINKKRYGNSEISALCSQIEKICERIDE